MDGVDKGDEESNVRLRLTNGFIAKAAVAAILLLTGLPAHSQSGKKEGPAPRAADGKIDLTGVWTSPAAPICPATPPIGQRR